jgi:hypothetical protein
VSFAVAFVAQGKLYTVAAPGDEPALVHSPFVQELLDRVERNRDRDQWKSTSMGWNLGGSMAVRMGGVVPNAEVRQVAFAGAARGREPGQLIYAVHTDHVGAVFDARPHRDDERRIIHRNQFNPRDLALSPDGTTLAMSVPSPDGAASIAVMQTAGRGLKPLTAGDSVDAAPAWSPDGKTIYYHTAGIGRAQSGAYLGLGPFAIAKLSPDALAAKSSDPDGGEPLEIVLEDEYHDLILPRPAADGALYFIRRPYEPLRGAPSFGRLLLDTVLFPFRLAIAVVAFLNVFSLIFAQKPLLTSGGPKQEGADLRYVDLYGRVVDARRAAARGEKRAAGALVPNSWQLVRRDAAGRETVLARGVVHFDLAPDGAVIWTDGGTVYRQPGDASPEPIARGKLIERVVATA